MSEINTGGGLANEGDARAGRDVIGRDQIIVNPDRLSSEEVLRALYDRVAGNPMRGIPGLIGTVEQMSAAITATNASQAEQDRRHEALKQEVQAHKDSADAKFSTLSMWIWLTLGIAGLEGVALLILTMLRS